MRYRGFRGFNIGPIEFIIIANIILYIASAIKPELIQFLGLLPIAILARPWTVITSMFIHGGIWHILANMLTFYFFGSYLARLVGERNFLITYFVGGLLGNLLYLFIALATPLGTPFSIAVGASGAVFAVGGALTVLRPKLTVFIIPIPVPIPLWVAVIGGFLILSFNPGVAWEAHLGGLVVGLIAGYFFRRRGRYFSL